MNAIVCPVRNGLHYTREAMKTFLAQDAPDINIVFIDNASTDGTTDWLKTQGCFVFHNTISKSVAASWNMGLRWAFAHGAETCLVVNNDVKLRPDTYRLLAEDGGLFVTAVASDDPECIKPVKGPTGRWEYAAPDPDAKRPHPTMSCFLMRRECWDRVGPFDEDFLGGYAEDAMYHIAMERAGVKAYCIDLAFWHAGSGTMKCSSAEELAKILSDAERNRQLLFKKTGVHVGSPQYYAIFKTTAEAVQAEGESVET